MRKLLALLLFALPVGAQTIQNPSFEAPATLNLTNPNGPWNTGPIPGWTISGGVAGLWQVVGINEFASVPDGTTIAYSNGGKISQDLGVPAQANTIYTLIVWTGRRSDQWETPTNSYTISLSGGATILCTQSAQLSTIPVGTFTKQVLTCPVGATPPAGNLLVSLGCDGPQCAFDNLSLTSASAVVPQPQSLTVKAQLLWCAACNQTDDVPAAGRLVIAQTNGPTATFVIQTDGSISASGIIDIAQDPLEFTLYLIDSSGVAQPGAIIKQTVPRFALYSPSFTLGTLSLGVVRISHVTIPLGGTLALGTTCQIAAGCPAVRLASIDQFKLL